MTDLSVAKKLSPYKPKNKVRFVTAASLFDGHDASINIMRRILQATGAEVIHLGHNRSVQEIVNAALQEDVQGIAITSYQGGHVEFFKYMIDLLKANGGENIKVFGGGGGVIVPAEIRELHDYGVTRIYSPEDGGSMGLQGMINEVVQQRRLRSGRSRRADSRAALAGLKAGDKRLLARVITALENGVGTGRSGSRLLKAAAELNVPVLGITGTGGAGKSSLTDEMIRRFRLDQGDTVKIGRDLDRPLAQAHRRCPARRPHPHECDRAPEHLHALAGHPRYRQRDFRRTARGDRRLQAGRFRSGHRRNLRHRPGRCRHRALRRCCRCM